LIQMQDLRHALRGLARRPGFAAVAIATLALGIGANTAIFSVIDAVLLRPLPYPRSERLVMPWEFSEEMQQRVGFDRLPSSPGDVTDFVTRNTTFEELAFMRPDRLNLTGGGEPERIGALRVSRNFFETLGVQAIHGRTFADGDGQSGRVVLIGYTLWQRRFGGDPAILGRTLSLNGEPSTVIGVLPSWFRFPVAGELPETFGYSPNPEIWSLDMLTPQQQRTRAGKTFAMVGRLREGVSGRTAEVELASIAADIARDFPASNAGWTVRVVSLRDQIVGGIRPALMVLLAAVGAVLLIACANVANLLLVRAAARQREVCVRHALGADRLHLVRQFLAESIVLALAAGALGLVVGWWGLRVLLSMLPTTLPSLAAAGLDWRVATFTVVVSLATGVVFGMIPALQATRVPVIEGLREGARGTIGSRRIRRTRSALVVVEVALALVLLVSAVLLTQTFVRLLDVDPGFRSEGALTMEINLPRTAYPGDRPVAFFERLLSRLAALPGVDSVGATSSLPLSGLENLRQVTLDGRPRPAPGQEIVSDYRVVMPSYFRSMGIPLLAGELLPAEPGPGQYVLLINQTMARTAFRDENPLGQRLKLTSFDQDSTWYTVVGVVGDTRHTALDSVLRPQVYVPMRLDPAGQMVVVLRTDADPAGYATAARAAVHEIDPNQPVGRVRPMQSIVAESVSSRRFTMFLVGTFAVLALVLSVVGLYAVISFSVAERTHEMGLRVALGASPASLLRLVLSEGLFLVATGIVVGLGGAFVMTRFLESMLFGVRAYDAVTFVAVPLLLIVAALLGCLVPARRATRVDPMVALRAE
jgi:putative ABC transport system permease protein